MTKILYVNDKVERLVKELVKITSEEENQIFDEIEFIRSKFIKDHKIILDLEICCYLFANNNKINLQLPLTESEIFKLNIEKQEQDLRDKLYTKFLEDNNISDYDII